MTPCSLPHRPLVVSVLISPIVQLVEVGFSTLDSGGPGTVPTFMGSAGSFCWPRANFISSSFKVKNSCCHPQPLEAILKSYASRNGFIFEILTVVASSTTGIIRCISLLHDLQVSKCLKSMMWSSVGFQNFFLRLVDKAPWWKVVDMAL